MNGILLIDKPKGLTSHDIVNIVRQKFKFKKVGHAGSLDPLATGLLIILIGSATKLSDRFLNSDKEYEVKCLLGLTTDTDDLEGKIKKKSLKLNIDRQRFDDALLKFKGKIKQKVPRYSAVKINGRKLYELARKGKNINLPEREVIIYDIEVEDFNLPEVSLKVKCSKGTYIRALCRDLGEVLDCGGCVSELRRIKSNPFSIGEAIKLKDIKIMNKNELSKFLKPITDYESL